MFNFKRAQKILVLFLKIAPLVVTIVSFQRQVRNQKKLEDAPCAANIIEQTYIDLIECTVGTYGEE
jgi:hypothetical protein